MSPALWRSTEGASSDSLVQRTGNSPLDHSNLPRTSWVRRQWTVTDLSLNRRPGEEDSFSCSLSLERDGFTDSGRTPKPVKYSLCLSLRVRGKEIPLLTGLLSKEIQTSEELHSLSVSSEKLLEQITELREEIQSLELENRSLKHTLMEIQRPKRVS